MRFKWACSSFRLCRSWFCSLRDVHSGQPPDKHKPPPPVKSAFDPMTQQLNKARGVQATIDQSADKTRKAIDSQERGD